MLVKEAMLYDKGDDGYVSCRLCSHRCRIKPGMRGICGVRENRQGSLYSLVYGLIIAENVDPIEKKPLFHFYSGSVSYSIATVGCNFRCAFCQNHEISQLPRESDEIAGRSTEPEDIVMRAVQSGAKSISYTYTEPTIYFEYAYDIARFAREKGLANVFVTNGYMTAEVLDVMGSCLNAANVDLKSFSDDFYRTYCGARLQPVLDTLAKMKAMGVWVEVTTLLIPGLNDSDEELEQIARFIADLGKETPWHISRFHPRYRMESVSATPSGSIRRAIQIGKEAGLDYVYSGNIPGDEGENTFCAACDERLIGRYGYRIEEYYLEQGRCPRCGNLIAGTFV
ncbi:MAG: GTP 3',8-cyclase [Syntrophus sp. SKADARSKE-3]|nr:GTP 3',8-cyclase [Syntrophus sp. SKADARSKE-3]